MLEHHRAPVQVGRALGNIKTQSDIRKSIGGFC